MIRAVLFDLDGVLADTEPLQWMAYRQVLLELGVDVGLEEYRREWIAAGVGPEYACRKYDLQITPDEMRKRKGPVYRRLLDDGDVLPRAGAAAVLARLRPSHRLALVTNSVQNEVALLLGRFGLLSAFDALIGREDYVRAKPAPDGYLAGAARLGVSASECAVVEDTPRGVRAGVAAGMHVIAVPNELTYDADFTGCARRLAHLDALTAELLAELG